MKIGDVTPIDVSTPRIEPSVRQVRSRHRSYGARNTAVRDRRR